MFLRQSAWVWYLGQWLSVGSGHDIWVPSIHSKIKNCKRSFHPFLLKGFPIRYHQLTVGMFALVFRNVVKIRSTKNWCGKARLEQTRDFLKTLWLMTKELLRAVKLLNIFRWSGGLVPAASLVVWGNSCLYRHVTTHDFLLGHYQGWDFQRFGPLGTTAKINRKLTFFLLEIFLCNAKCLGWKGSILTVDSCFDDVGIWSNDES